jgi:hypothetical protein
LTKPTKPVEVDESVLESEIQPEKPVAEIKAEDKVN